MSLEKLLKVFLNSISKEEKDKSLKWRDVLHDVAGLSGFVVLNSR